jgi:hypothetical protein
MPGAVSVRFAREPDYFLGATIMGDPSTSWLPGFMGRWRDRLPRPGIRL